MLSAISVRMSPQTPSVRGAAKTWSWTLDSSISACALWTVCCSWSSSRRSCIPSTGVIRKAPRSTRSTSSCTSELSNGPRVRLYASSSCSVASSSATRSSSCSSCSPTSSSSPTSSTGSSLRPRRKIATFSRPSSFSLQSSTVCGSRVCRRSGLAGPEATARSVPSLPPRALRERIHVDEVHLGHPLDHELRDAVAAAHLERLLGVEIDEVDEELAAVPRVDGAGRVDDGDPVASRQPRAGVGERRIPLRQGYREAGGDQHPLARRQRDVDAGHEVSAGVARMRVGRQRQARVEAPSPDHDAVRADPRWGGRPWWCGLRPVAAGGVGQAAHSRQTILPPLSLASWLRWCTK